MNFLPAFQYEFRDISIRQVVCPEVKHSNDHSISGVQYEH